MVYSEIRHSMIMLVLFLVYMTGLVLCAIDYTRQTGFEELKQMVIDCNKTANARTAELVISGNGAIAILLDIDYEFVEEATDKMFRCLGNEGFGIPIGQKLNGWRDIFGLIGTAAAVAYLGSSSLPTAAAATAHETSVPLPSTPLPPYKLTLSSSPVSDAELQAVDLSSNECVFHLYSLRLLS
ncbi:uncharacterized protein V2V93DRAFT_384886 [Kockiozyma suomiensis]|uniref:uncharacterized protein n=1 Tax=Kockiozyma suomiensis TaxID=1337062 RepID=UPI003342EC36